MNALFNSLITLLSVNHPDDAQKLAAQAQQVTQEATAKADSLLPNGSLFNGIINNYSDTGTRRCDWTIDIT